MKKSDINPLPPYFERYINFVENSQSSIVNQVLPDNKQLTISAQLGF